MFEHATESPHVGERGLEATPVKAATMAPSRLDESRETAPSRARRMRYDRMRAVVVACIARLIPWIDVAQIEVRSVRVNEERGNHMILVRAS